eukprot:jgi/Chrpa1/4685/Chrysochromulina_OHIO_Genome00001515-RA
MIEQSDELNNGRGARGEPLWRVVRLFEARCEGGDEGSRLVRLPLFDEVARQPMDSAIVGYDGARRSLHNHNHVVGYEILSIIKCKPCGAPHPAAPFEPRCENMIERRRALRRAVGEAGCPVRPGELSSGMVKSEVDDPCHRRAVIEFAPTRDSLESVVCLGRSPCATPPCRTWCDVEVAGGEASPGQKNMAHDRVDRLHLAVALVGAIGGDDAHRRRVRCASPVAKVGGDRHGPGVEDG